MNKVANLNNIVLYQNETESKILLESALTDKIDDRIVYMKGIDVSYQYEGYNAYTMDELDK